MYENCLNKFYKYNTVEVLTNSAHVFVKANRLREAYNGLLNARRIAPHDLALMYNVALVQQRLAQEILKDENSTLNCALQAINELQIAQKTFTWISGHGDPHHHDLNQALQEAQQCSDLLSQSTYHEIREERRRIERKKRQEFVERTKNLLAAAESQVTPEKSQRSTGGTKKARQRHDDEDEFINDTTILSPIQKKSDSNNENGETTKLKKKTSHRKRSSRTTPNDDEISQNNAEQLSDNESDNEDKLKRKPTSRKSTSRSKRSSISKTSHRQSESTGRYESRAIISISEDESDNEPSRPTIPPAEEEVKQEEVSDNNARSTASVAKQEGEEEEEQEQAPEDLVVSDED